MLLVLITQSISPLAVLGAEAKKRRCCLRFGVPETADDPPEWHT